MKTEIVIDDRVARRLSEAAEIAHISFNQAIERAINAGLPALPQKAPKPPTYVTQPHDFGASLDDPKAMLAKLQEEEDIKRYGRGGG